MEIIEYFSAEDKAHWQQELLRADWGAAEFLVKLLNDPAQFDRDLGAGSRVYLMAEGGELLAFATLSRQDCIRDESLTPWIGFVYTFPPHRGRRLSQKIMEHAEAEARKAGHRCVYVATDHVGLYEKYGYRYLESRIDCWGDDTRILAKEL